MYVGRPKGRVTPTEGSLTLQKSNYILSSQLQILVVQHFLAILEQM